MEKLRSLRDAVGYILLFVAVQYLCSLVASYGVLAYFYRMDPGASAEEYVAFAQAFDSRYGTALLSLSEVITLAAVWAMGRARGLGFGAMIGRGRGISQSLVPWLLLAGLCGNVFVSGAMDLLPFSQALQDSYQQASSALDSSWMLMNVLSVAVLAPITEEVVFRGLALSRLRTGHARLAGGAGPGAGVRADPWPAALDALRRGVRRGAGLGAGQNRQLGGGHPAACGVQRILLFCRVVLHPGAPKTCGANCSCACWGALGWWPACSRWPGRAGGAAPRFCPARGKSRPRPSPP